MMNWKHNERTYLFISDGVMQKDLPFNVFKNLCPVIFRTLSKKGKMSEEEIYSKILNSIRLELKLEIADSMDFKLK